MLTIANYMLLLVVESIHRLCLRLILIKKSDWSTLIKLLLWIYSNGWDRENKRREGQATKINDQVQSRLLYVSYNSEY